MTPWLLMGAGWVAMFAVYGWLFFDVRRHYRRIDEARKRRDAQPPPVTRSR